MSAPSQHSNSSTTLKSSHRAQVVLVIVFLVIFTQVLSPTTQALTNSQRGQLLSLSPLPAPPEDPTNRWSNDPLAADLGHDLFFSTDLSLDRTVSCATCHNPKKYFTDGLPLAQGLAVGTRHTQSVVNSAHQPWLTWDGRADSLWSQALHPFENPSEMGLSRAQVMERISQDPSLAKKYQAVFGAPTNLDQAHDLDRAFAQVGKSIAAYERTLLSEPTPFDQWIDLVRQGNEQPTQSFSAQAIRGAKLFIGRANCISCHNGPNFSDGQFHLIGAPLAGQAMATDRGRIDGIMHLRVDPFNAAGAFSDDPNGSRAKITLATVSMPDQWGQFRTPSLRNVSVTAPYMHQGQLATLRDVVHFYSTLEGATALDHHSENVLVRLELSPQESEDLLVFLHSLTANTDVIEH